MVDWLSKHWFLAGIATTILGAAYAGGAKIVTMEQAIKSNAETKQEIRVIKDSQNEIKANQARIDERTIMILNAIEDLKHATH